MSMDWTNTNHTNEFEFAMVTPSDLNDETYGFMHGVLLDKTSITESYYSDTRYSGKLSYVGDDWIVPTFIRIRHRVPEWNYVHVLGTFLATNDGSSWSKGEWTTNLTLYSLLYGMKTQLGRYNWTVEAGTTVKEMFGLTCGWSHRTYRIEPSANDYALSSTMVFPSNKSTLSRVNAMAELADDRVEVDPEGVVVLEKYVSPASKTPTFTIDMTSIHGVAKDKITRTSDYLRTPNRVVVEYTFNQDVKVGTESKQQELTISGEALVSVGPRSRGNIGYDIVDFHTVDDLTPATVAHATELAAKYLQEDQLVDLEWQIETIYLPIHEGDAGTLILPEGILGYGVERRVFVKSNDISLDPMTCSLTLKEVTSADTDSEW